MSEQFSALRQRVLRRVRYATNTHALLDDRVPPEGPFDAALTNGLLAIVAEEWPGAELRKGGRLKAARELLEVIVARGCPFSYIDVPILGDGLDVSQPIRHGRAHDEFAVVLRSHIAALAALDEHPALQFLELSEGQTIDRCVWAAFGERAESELPFDPKERSMIPDPEECDECGRLTFLASGWDIFGGTLAPGGCIACGFTRSEGDAYDQAVSAEIRRLIDSSD